MTSKTGVSLTDRHHAFAKAKVKEGRYESVSSVVAAGIEQIMRDEEEREIALAAMRETIAQRMTLPRDEWVDVETDDLFEQARQRLAAR
jgi:antitoxin ParD1/3/4